MEINHVEFIAALKKLDIPAIAEMLPVNRLHREECRESICGKYKLYSFGKRFVVSTPKSSYQLHLNPEGLYILDAVTFDRELDEITEDSALKFLSEEELSSYKWQKFGIEDVDGTTALDRLKALKSLKI